MTRRQRQEWLLSLPVEERVPLLYGPEDGPVLTALPEAVTEGGGGFGPRRIVRSACAYPDCERPRRAQHRLCNGHRKQWQRTRTLQPLRRLRSDAASAPDPRRFEVA